MFDYLTDEKLEELGRGFLRHLGIEDQVCPDGMTVIQKIKHKDKSFGYRRVPDREMKDAEGHWDFEKREVSMRESIFVGMQHGDSHPRFVVFHEISHYVLGHEGTRARAVEKIRGYSAAKVQHEEKEASRLAVILMAPEHLVPENATAEEISEKFGLSLTAAILRKEEVDRIRRRRRGELRPLPESIKEILRKARDQGMNIRTKLD